MKNQTITEIIAYLSILAMLAFTTLFPIIEEPIENILTPVTTKNSWKKVLQFEKILIYYP